MGKYNNENLRREKKPKTRKFKFTNDMIVFTDKLENHWTVGNLKDLVEAVYQHQKAQNTFSYYFPEEHSEIKRIF